MNITIIYYWVILQLSKYLYELHLKQKQKKNNVYYYFNIDKLFLPIYIFFEKLFNDFNFNL